jgi:hypothetical protein
VNNTQPNPGTVTRSARINGVKPALPARRHKRVVENDDFAAFVRRIIRAHSRRVADGDIEALRAFRELVSEVDTATVEAINGLRSFGYSWADIANRLGVSRQAAQMRWGTRTDRGRLDDRILDAGLGVSVALLAAVYADHHPGHPPAPICPGCGFEYPPDDPQCPTLAVVGPVLYRRRCEDAAALSRLSGNQLADLHQRRRTTGHRRPSSASFRRGPLNNPSTRGGR